jgi:methionine-rich copper-binding protein CopC
VGRLIRAIESVRPRVTDGFWRRLFSGRGSSRANAVPQVRAPHGMLELEPLELRQLLAVNPIVAENALPGNPQSEWDIVGIGDPSIQGYATQISVNQGETVRFKIDDDNLAPYHLNIYRMGYYGGMGARKVATITSSQATIRNQPAPLSDPVTGLVDAGNWSVTASWNAPADATSGIYFAKIVREDTGGASHMFFIVRDDDGHSDMLFQTSDTTWQAYNQWGGDSVYVGDSDEAEGRAVKISYNRPLDIRSRIGGFGTYNSPFHAEYPMVRWLESNGYDVSYFTDLDSDRRGTEIKEHRVFMSVGHDEYWSGQQRANVEAARDAGVNLAFFSGNEVFWKIRWENSTDGSNEPYKTMVVYKESKADAKIDPSPTWTGTWRDGRFSPPSDGGRPENGLTGTIYMADRTSNDIGISMQVPATDGQLRFWRNTSVANLAAGQVATLGDRVVGYETDEDLDNGFRPAGLVTMSSTTFNTNSKVTGASGGTIVAPGTSTHKITLYRAPSGALVFGAGTVQWSWGLDGQHEDGASTPSLAMQQATVNLFADMGVQPATLQSGLVQQAMSTDVLRPTSTINFPAPGAGLTAAVPVTITGTAVDSGGGVVAGIEVSTDGGRTWHPATGRSTWSYTWTPTVPGPVTILSRAVDDSGNVEVGGAGVSVNVVVAPTSTAGLVAAYNFDQGAGSSLTDVSGNGRTGTISNATWSGSGRYGGALSFNGINSVVNIANAASLQLTTGMTLEAWVSPASLGDWGAVIYKPRSALALSYGLYATDGVNRPPSGYVGISNVDVSAIGTSPLPLGAWNHLALTYDNSSLKFYVNGVLVTSSPTTGPIMTSTNALTIGNDNISEAFQGLIDDVRIYNRALTSSEIGADMSTPVGSGSMETTPPVVSLTAPLDGASVSGVTTLTATSSDNVSIAGVQFLLNGQPIGNEDNSAPYTLSWDTRTLPNGSYVLSARARDAAGNTTTSTQSTVSIANAPDLTPPSVAMTNPVSGVTVGGRVVLSATASDNLTVAGVQFQVNGANVGPLLTNAPYRLLWDASLTGSGPATITAIAYDAAGNPGTAELDVNVDATAPTVTGFTPADAATGLLTNVHLTATFSESVQATTTTFDVRDADGNNVTGSLAYDDATHTVSFVPNGSLSPATTYSVTVSGTKDLVGNGMGAPVIWSFTTVNSITGATIWNSVSAPLNASVSDVSAVELGVKFRSELSGYITGLRFYKGSLNTGTHVGHLWTSTGTLLATGTFSNETALGWQEVTFANPVAISANTTYVASYYAPNGGYAADGGYFTSSVNSSPLRALGGAEGANGVYRYGSGGGFPTSSFNSTNYWVDVVFGTTNIVQDTTPPSVTSRTPAVNAIAVPTNSSVSATFNESVQEGTIAFQLRDPAGNLVTAAVAYDDVSHMVTLTPSAALAPSITYTATLSGAQDLADNPMSTAVVWSFTTGTSATAPTSSIWVASAAPTNPSANDGSAVQLGVKFRSDVNGYISGIRFYKGAGNTGTHVGNLWSAGGSLLATATFVNESASGWQQVQFSSPVAITANTVYVASYYAPVGHYAADNGYFGAAGVDNGTLHALSNAVAAGGNGVYVYGSSSSFPTGSFNSTNYWVDVVFSTAPADTITPTVTTQAPAANAIGVSVATTVTAAFNKQIQPNTLSFVLRDAANNAVPATVTYNSTTLVATLTPNAALVNNTTYTATVSGAKDLAGNAMSAPVTWSFTTSPVVVGASVFSTTAIPATASVNDTGAVELGMKFTADYGGYVTGIRFYKGSQNTGTHVGHLWTSTGTLLGTVTFAGESASGWQFAALAAPVAIQAGTTYVVSYFAPNGRYSLTGAFFATTGTDNGPLHAPSTGAAGGNGLYAYGASGTFPANTFNASNYWVDVVYSTALDTTAPTVSSKTPAAGATGVAATTSLSVTFNESVQAGSIVFTLKDAVNNTVPATFTYDDATHTATLTPASALGSAATYTASVSGAKDAAGNTMASPVTWSFTTAGNVAQTSVADFSTGTTTGTSVTDSAGGEIELTAVLRDDFAGAALGSSWTSSSWASEGGGPTAITVATGALSVAGGQVRSVSTFANTPIEGRVSFGAAPYQNFGWTTGLSSASGNYWAMFGTYNTPDTLFARVNVNGAETNVNLGGLPAGFHLYRIRPITDGLAFYVDDVLRTTVNAPGLPTTTALSAVLSSFAGAPQPALQADWVRVNSFGTSGTFVSSVLDAGRAVTWGTIDWTAALPPGTSIAVQTRTGNTDAPDGTWSVWSANTDGGVITSPSGRYIQYLITLTTSEPTATPELTDILLTW